MSSFLKNCCVFAETCYNGLVDHDEEDVDCGGSCKPCCKYFHKSIEIQGNNIIGIILFVDISITLQGVVLMGQKETVICEALVKLMRFVWKLENVEVSHITFSCGRPWGVKV